MRSIDRSVPSRITNAFVDAVRIASARVGARSARRFGSLGDIPVGGRGSHAASGCELGIRVPHPQVGKCEQSLPARVQTPPAGADHSTALPQTSGEEAQSRTGHVDARRVDKHAKPLVETVLLVENPSNGAAWPRGTRRCLGPAAAEQAAVEEPAGLVAGGDRLLPRPGRPQGPKSGPSPVDRARPGSKHHIITDGQGIPLAVSGLGTGRRAC
ncbi:hypothetical protein GCM10022295_91820 [Streptomyces osmaniensis]|uniref:Transposase n=1 Tax=Streptomyces osmaniensis TaxID=593134 RepID=A0ABP6Z2H8_9ACTN